MGKLSRELRMGIHNRFDIEVVDVETGEVKQRAKAENVICDQYYHFLTDWSASSGTTIQYGKGTGTPSSSDTALFSRLNEASDNSSYSPFDRFDFSNEHNGVWSRQIKRAIPNTVDVGQTITEVGVVARRYVSQSYYYYLVTHAMLQDMNGNPISIVHTSTDVIYVYATLYLHYSGQDGDIHLFGASSSDNGGLIRQLLLAGSTPSLGGAILGSNGGDGGNSWYDYQYSYDRNCKLGSASTSTDYATKKITYTMNQTPIGRGNLKGGILGIRCPVYDSSEGDGEQLVNLTIECGETTIPPTRITGESIGVGDGSNTKFKTKFSHPHNATVYVNGVAISSGVTVKDACVISTGSGASIWDVDSTDNSRPFVRWRHPQKNSLIIPRNYTASNQLKPGYPIEILEPEIGLKYIYATNGDVKGSNDGVTWYDVETAKSSAQMNQAGAHYKFYKNVGSDSTLSAYINAYDGYNIIFDTAPAQGDVITIDYTTDYIPKDSDHVLDMEITLTFGEWIGE